MSPDAIVLPAFALVALTFVSWIRLYRERIGEVRRRRIQPQRLATRREAAEVLQDTRASDHFRNLFEVPVLFYALCALLAATDAVTPLLVGLAWLFVGLRVLQAGVHLTYNRVLHRFTVYVAGTAVVFLMWVIFAFQSLAA
ncbi:MAG: MAPEG family protein [Halofilum sp. (in: g-proteobacteria)]|nr:MAPEG family protein [Halofilum sp. (in: g-proteobacteria)]